MNEPVGVTLPVEDGLPAAEYVGLAQLAERAGYDAVLAGEDPPAGWHAQAGQYRVGS